MTHNTLIHSAMLLLLSGVAATGQEDRTSQTYEVGSAGELSLSNIAGSIVVEGTDGTTIEIEAVKRGGDQRELDSVRIDITHIDDRVRVVTRHGNRDGDRRHRHSDSVSVDYRVKVPSGSEIELASVSGNIRVTGVHGEATLKNVSGDIEASGARGLTEAKSVSGDVTVTGVQSGDDLEVKSVSGDVIVRDVDVDDLEAGSVSGSIQLDGVTCERGEFDSVSGNIRYSGALVAGGSYELKSHSGNITLMIGEEVGFELEATTFSGKIESDFEMRVTERSRKGRKLTAVIGNGSAVVETTSFSGNVSLRRR